MPEWRGIKKCTTYLIGRRSSVAANSVPQWFPERALSPEQQAPRIDRSFGSQLPHDRTAMRRHVQVLAGANEIAMPSGVAEAEIGRAAMNLVVRGAEKSLPLVPSRTSAAVTGASPSSCRSP